MKGKTFALLNQGKQGNNKNSATQYNVRLIIFLLIFSIKVLYFIQSSQNVAEPFA